MEERLVGFSVKVLVFELRRGLGSRWMERIVAA